MRMRRATGRARSRWPVYAPGVTAAGPSSALPVRVALDVALALARDPERARRDVLGDDGARPGVGAVAHGDGRDERRVDRDPHLAADGRPVLVDPVVVGGDGPGPEVGALPHLGVADVGQVRHLRAGADDGVLDLYEGPGLGPLAEI